jgi:hypothetical protein
MDWKRSKQVAAKAEEQRAIAKARVLEAMHAQSDATAKAIENRAERAKKRAERDSYYAQALTQGINSSGGILNTGKSIHTLNNNNQYAIFYEEYAAAFRSWGAPSEACRGADHYHCHNSTMCNCKCHTPMAQRTLSEFCKTDEHGHCHWPSCECNCHMGALPLPSVSKPVWSCMWCAQVYADEGLLEAHEAVCGGS